jgi:hypothetical protein
MLHARSMGIVLRGERPMEYEIEGNRTGKLTALLLTVFVVGGGIIYALTAA